MSDVRMFGAAGDGRTDDTEAIEHALKDGEGTVDFSRGEYLITRTIKIELDKLGRIGLVGFGGTPTIVMAAAGPAFHIVGTHGATAQPTGFKPEIWQRQRMPTLMNLEIEGRHPEACGVLLEGTMQSTFEGVLLRKLKHGLHIRNRARNVLVSHCHIYDNSGIGIFFDHLNLHQAIIVGSHISYCKRGGIKILASEIRNLQITGNDIEYNFDKNEKESADIWIDSTDDKASVREATIASNTIQATLSPGGANVRIVGRDPENNQKAGLTTIAGNLIGSQEVNVDLQAVRGVVLSGNVIYSGHRRNLVVEGSRNIVLNGNCFDHNPDYAPNELCTGIRIVDSSDVAMSGTVIQDSQTGKHTVKNAEQYERDALVELIRCRRATLSGCHIVDGVPIGLLLDGCSRTSVTGCQIAESRTTKLTVSSLVWRGAGQGNFLDGNSIQPGTSGAIEIDPAADVRLGTNRLD
ncbi:MAG: right-handed parallel beta-helix repeat-containing protein [Planctomycetia bacterium]|nr:right-handed parallel beta-helix repeat-containing protein [Planctomycetia bacterium]